MSLSFQEIGDTGDWWVWALIEFNGKLYVGTYDIDTGPKGFNYPPWTHIQDFDTDESIPDFGIFKSNLYAGSEDEGKIFKMDIADPTDWDTVHDDAFKYALYLEVLGGDFYCGLIHTGDTRTKIIKSLTGELDSWEFVTYIADCNTQSSILYNGEMYILGRQFSDKKCLALKSSNGKDWEEVGVLCRIHKGIWYGATVFKGNLYLGLGEVDDYSSPAKIYKYDGSTATEVLSKATGFFPAGCVFNNQIYFLTAAPWKSTGDVYLYRSDTGAPGDWGDPIKTFKGGNFGRAITVYDNHLYLGIGGKVYRMDEDAPSNCVAHFVSPDKSYCTWQDNSDDEVGFRIEYSINEGAWTFFENKGVNATQSSERQFTIGNNVKWRVRAYNDTGYSTWANSDNVYIGTGGVKGVWTTQADFESGTLDNVLVPEGLNRLELKRLSLTGTGIWIFDGGPGRKFKWLSFEHTNPGRNIYYRDDFRNNSLAAWTIVGGTWQGISQYMRGTGNLSWGTNRVRVGSTDWKGQDILLKVYLSSSAGAGLHNFFLRADTQGDNVNAYGWQLDSGYISAFRVANGSVLDNIQKGTSGMTDATWYWLRLQIYTFGGNVIQKVKWWLPGNEEPEAWNYSHTWTGIWRSSGCFSIGRHTADGENRYDNPFISRKEGIPFPSRIMFWVSSIADLPAIRNLGCDGVHHPTFDGMTQTQQIAFMAECERLRLQVGWSALGGTQYARDHREETIKYWKDSPLVSHVIITGDAQSVPAATQIEKYNLFKGWAPDLLFGIDREFWFARNGNYSEDAFDILFYYCYPYNTGHSVDYAYERIMLSMDYLIEGTFPMIPLLQCFTDAAHYDPREEFEPEDPEYSENYMQYMYDRLKGLLEPKGWWYDNVGFYPWSAGYWTDVKRYPAIQTEIKELGAATSVSFKFWPSKDGTSWGSEHTDIIKVPSSRFIKIQATLSRTDLLSAMPTLEDMTLRYRLLSQAIFI